MKWLVRSIDWIVPPRCVVCVGVLEPGCAAICRECARRLPWWRLVDGCPRCGFASPDSPTADGDGAPGDSPGCPGCLVEGSPLHTCRALMRYEAPIDRWIPAFKQPPGSLGPAPDVTRAIEALADALALRVSHEAAPRLDLVTSVPLHPRRRRRRGFNHADTIAGRLAAGLGCRFQRHLLERVRNTPPQAGLRGAARRANVQRAFRACPASREVIPDTRIWLVDDVLTTGSTLEAAANALLDAGALEVRGLTLAATLPARQRLRRPDERTSERGKATV